MSEQGDVELRDLLLQVSPSARDKLREVLTQESDPGAIAQELLVYSDADGDAWALLVDLLTMRPDIRQRVVQLLDEIQAGNDEGPIGAP